MDGFWPRCFLVISCAVCCCLFSVGEVSAQTGQYTVKKIVLDAGHGGKDPGARGRFSLEKALNLTFALKIGRLIEERVPGVEVLYTRKKDVFLSLHDRAAFANKNQADLFISIHCNWVSKPSVYGTETYIMGIHKSEDNFEVAKRENSVILYEEALDLKTVYQGFDPTSHESYILFNLYQSAYQQSSLNLASEIERQFAKRAGRKSLGVKTAGFWVLWETSMPSVLVELGYLSNRKEERQLSDSTYQSYIASAIYRAFKTYKEEMEAIR